MTPRFLSITSRSPLAKWRSAPTVTKPCGRGQGALLTGSASVRGLEEADSTGVLQELETPGLHAPYHNVLTAWLVTTSRTKLIPSGRGICTPRQVRSVNGRGKLSLGVHQSIRVVVCTLPSTLSPLLPTRSPYRSAKASLRFAAASSVEPVVGSAEGEKKKDNAHAHAHAVV